MSSGFRHKKNTGTVRRQQRQSRISPFKKKATARSSSGWSTSVTSSTKNNPQRKTKNWRLRKPLHHGAPPTKSAPSSPPPDTTGTAPPNVPAHPAPPPQQSLPPTPTASPRQSPPA